jgi:two-component system, LuxR family, sensor kinase FixL
MELRRWRNDLLIGVGYCLLALALDWMSNIGLYRSLGVTPWTPAVGLALGFAYVRGSKAWPWIIAAELMTTFLTNPVDFTAAVKVAISLSSGACWLFAAAVLQQSTSFDGTLRSSNALLRLFIVAVAASIVQSLLYLTALWTTGLTGNDLIYPIWWRLFVGDLVGILVVAPLPILLHAGWRPSRPTWLHLVQFTVLACSLWAIFNLRTATTYQLFYLLFLPLIWTALRDGIGGAAIMLNIAQLGLIAGTQLRVDLVPGTGSLQVLMIALAMTGLLVGAIVTEREDASRRLQEQSAALGRTLRLRSAGETAAAIAHQINQPITAISTYASVARDALAKGDNALAGTALTKLTEQCDRAASVMRSIRDLVKQGTLSRSPVRLQKLLVDLRSAHATECSDLGIKFEIDIPGIHPPISADIIQLEQALDNLIVNSIEAIRETGKSGLVRIKVRSTASQTQLVVEDDGPGFAAGLDAIATTPFMTTKKNGSGLGLAIARSVAEAHGGSLSIIQRQGGASVRLILPNIGTQDDHQNNQHH